MEYYLKSSKQYYEDNSDSRLRFVKKKRIFIFRNFKIYK